MTAANNIPNTEDAFYSIGKVSEITGVNAITLRAWERRYGIIKPKRTAKGHRLYSNDDISRLQKATRLIKKGIQIGQVKDILNSEFEPLPEVIPKNQRGDGIQWREHQEAILTFLDRHDMSQLAILHHQLFASYSAMELDNMLCGRLLSELQSKAQNDLKAAEYYHTYYGFLCAFLTQQLVTVPVAKSSTRILIVDQASSRQKYFYILWYLNILRDEGFNAHCLGDSPVLEVVANIAENTHPKGDTAENIAILKKRLGVPAG